MTTSVITVNAVPQTWKDTFLVDALSINKYSKYIGSDEASIIQMHNDLTRPKHGDTLTMTLFNELDKNNFVEGNETLEGSEDLMISRTFSIIINKLRYAVELSDWEQFKSAVSMMNAAKKLLMMKDSEILRQHITDALGSINRVNYVNATEAQKDAWLVDNIDRAQFGALVSNSSSLDHSTSLANIDNTNDKLTYDLVTLIKRKARAAAPKIRAISVDESEAFVLFVPNLAFRDLSKDTFVQAANRDARNRGLSNPIFTGADLILDNVAIIQIDDIEPIVGVGNGGIDVSPCYLCGAQAIGLAWGKRPFPIQNVRDFGHLNGVGMEQIRKVEKLLFGTGTSDTNDLKDHGILTCFVATVADA